MSKIRGPWIKDALGKTVPFSAHCTASDPAWNNRHRLNQYRRFIGTDYMTMFSLDLGPKNYIGANLGILNCTGDLDLNMGLHYCRGCFEQITSFEVLNHVMNPLYLTQQCYDMLVPGGRLYLATPLLWGIPWFHGKNNFSEYKRDKIEQMHKYVGFRVVRYEVHNPWPLLFMFTGIRPFFRVLFNRYQIWEFEKV